jgi:ATP-dependent Clp protease adaptor protein ClpS
MAEKTIFKDEVRQKVTRPKMYRVILINDHYTTMEFVVEVLTTVFHKTMEEATKIMLDVHQKGKGTVGLYVYDIAVTKMAQVEEMANEQGFPLKTIMEEE